MKIHEYQGKEILLKFGVPVPRSIAVFSAQEAIEAAQQLGGDRWVVKAQIHSGGRGKGGGIMLASSPEEVRHIAGHMLGMMLVTAQTGAQGRKVRRLLIEECIQIQAEHYISILTDRKTQKIVMITCSEGGMDIEEVAKAHPEKILKIQIDPLIGITQAQQDDLVQALPGTPAQKNSFKDIFSKLYQAYIETDASLIEINPLVVDKSGAIKALDAKFNFDSNALFRQPEILAMRDLDEEDPDELEASAYDLSYVSLDGDIGCMVNGAGLAMATMDTIKLYGGEPANFLDVGGGASEVKVKAAFEIMLRNPRVKAILVNIFGGIMRCDIIAKGIVIACREVDLKIPLVVRMKGTYEKQGREILTASNLPIINAETMTEAAKKVIAAAQGEFR